MKKFTFIMLCVFGLFLTACTKEKPTLDFQNKQISLFVGEEITLQPQITNLDGTDLVNYEIADNSIINLSSGKFVALKSGTTTITATLKEYSEVSVTINVTVTEREYSITYQLNGGVNASNAPTKFRQSQLPITLPIPTRADYTFLGWFESSDFTGTAVTSIVSGTTTNKTYYAKWEETPYEIAYLLNGGTNATNAPTEFTVSQLPLTLPVPTRDGYTFLGWYTTVDFTGDVVTAISAGTNDNQKYFAKWEEVDYTITYQLDNGTLEPLAPTGYSASDLPLTLPVPTKTGYTFLGWYESSDFSGDVVSSIAAGTHENKVYYAKWEMTTYTITYELNGGTNDTSAPTTYKINQLTVLLPTPTKAGYQFGGWFESSDLTGSAVTEITPLNNYNMTFYAKWIELASYTFTYELNGGTNSTQNLSTYTILDLPLTLAEPTKDGYTFGGWYLNSDFTGEPVTTIDIAKNYTLYAKWEGGITDVYVNPDLAGTAAGTTVTYLGVDYQFGQNAFALLSEGLAVATGKVYVVGTITESVSITKSNISIIGPNAFVNPNTTVRHNEAILKGTLTVQTGVENLMINGLSFTETAKVVGNGVIKNLQFMYNSIYDTTEATSTWLETPGYASGFFVFQSANNNELSDFNISNNLFNNVSDVNINFVRITNLMVEGNVFKNFDRDAIRFDTGGFNQGNLTFIKNEFVNDTMGGYNGIYFRIYGGDQNTPTTITIEDNLFKNIGQVDRTQYSGAISMRNYQEKDTTIMIQYNTFETCANYIHIRNNATELNHSTYPWTANVNYNVFKGVPVTYYHKNWTGADAGIKNPTKMNFEFNYFEDNEGNPITDLTPYADKLLHLASYANNYQTRADYDKMLRQRLIGVIDLYVNAQWGTKTQSEVFDFEGKSLTYGVNAFSSLAEALNQSVAGNKIYVLPGTYADDVTISKDDITILTDNINVDPNKELRYPEAIITGIISINADVKNLTINGLAFTENAYVKALGTVSDFTFIYNNFFDSKLGSGDTGLLYFKTASTNTQQHYRLVITNNRFQATGNPRLVNIDKVEDLIVKNNYFETANSTYADALRVYYLSSTEPVIIEGNTFYKIYQYAVFFSAKHKATQIDLINNTFDTVSGAISIRAYDGTATADNKAIVNILYNTFKNITGTAVRVDHNGTVETSVLDINVNYNHFADNLPTAYFSISSSNTGTAANLDNNYFSEGLVPTASKLSGVASSQNNYATLEDLPRYNNDNTVVLPTNITILNPIQTLQELATYQLELTVSPSTATYKKVNYSSSDSNIISVSPTGLLTVKGTGTATITITSDIDSSVFTTITIAIVERDRIEVSYEGNGALEIGSSLQLNHTIYPNNNGTVEWSSSNDTIATVDQNGVVTAVGSGTVIITAKVANTPVQTQVGLTVYGNEVTDELLKYLISINTGVLTTQDLYYIGSDDGSADYLNRIYNSVSAYQFADLNIIRNMLPTDRANYSGVEMSSIEFITIHDTAGSGSTSTALANSNWATNPTNTGTSWHYTTGNDGVYQQVEDHIKAYHAGDGSRSFGLNDTGVVATTEKPVITINESGYFVLNGVQSTIMAPAIAPITPTGIYTTIGENGNYFMNNTYYNSSYKVIANQGGNNNSIGIESAVNNGSDVFLTWQNTAKLAAKLAVDHDLDADRVLFHNNFSGKQCPRTMLTAGLQEDFYELVEAEYHILKNYSDYTITFVSNNPSIVDHTGRVISRPVETTNVTYTITVSNGTTTQSITLNALVPGQLTY